MAHPTAEQADTQTPVAATCIYDSGAATECQPLCSEPPTRRLLHHMPCYGWFASDLCGRHLRPMQGRVYSGGQIVHELPTGRRP